MAKEDQMILNKKRSNSINDQKESQSKQTNKREHSEESDDEILPCKGCDVETLIQKNVLGYFFKASKISNCERSR